VCWFGLFTILEITPIYHNTNQTNTPETILVIIPIYQKTPETILVIIPIYQTTPETILEIIPIYQTTQTKPTHLKQY
jgi:hypothetical protein